MAGSYKNMTKKLLLFIFLLALSFLAVSFVRAEDPPPPSCFCRLEILKVNEDSQESCFRNDTIFKIPGSYKLSDMFNERISQCLSISDVLSLGGTTVDASTFSGLDADIELAGTNVEEFANSCSAVAKSTDVSILDLDYHYNLVCNVTNATPTVSESSGYDWSGALSGSGPVSVSISDGSAPTGKSAGHASIKLANPLGKQTELFSIAGKVINNIMGIVGSVALLVFIYGGVMWLTSAGSPEKVKKGTDAMVWAAVGIFIIFSSYAIISLVLKSLTGGQRPVSIEASAEGCYCQVLEDANNPSSLTEKKVITPALDKREECEKSHTEPVANKMVSECEWYTPGE